MKSVDSITIIKRIAKAWKDECDYLERENIPNDTALIHSEKMLSYRYCLEFSGLTLNEIISLGEAKDMDAAIEMLFSKTQK